MHFNYRRLKAMRIVKGLTTAQMASHLGVSRSAYSKKENNQRRITVEEFAIISKVLDISNEDMEIFFK